VMSNVDTVRASMDAYHSQDIEAATRLLAEDCQPAGRSHR
jgi:ketosteroid isomerase-like protein